MAYRNLYAFLSQVIPFQDSDLEKLYTYVRFLLTKLPRRSGPRYRFDYQVTLQYYRLQKIREGSIVLEKDSDSALAPITEAGTKKEKDEYAKLSDIIDVLNDRFGTDFTEADRYFFAQIEEELVADEQLSQQAQSNTIENFKYGFDDKFLNTLIERMDINREIFTTLAEAKILIEQWRKEYNQIRPHSALRYRPPAPEAIMPVIMSMGLT